MATSPSLSGPRTSGRRSSSSSSLVGRAGSRFPRRSSDFVASFCRETRSSQLRPLPNGRGFHEKALPCQEDNLRGAEGFQGACPLTEYEAAPHARVARPSPLRILYALRPGQKTPFPRSEERRVG